MLASRAGWGAFRQLASSSCTFAHRVDPLALTFARAYTSNSNTKTFKLPSGLHSTILLKSLAKRFYASRPSASKPKAHSGRATASRPRKTSGQTTKAKPAKKAAKPKSKPRRTKPQPKRKPARRPRKEKTADQIEAQKAKDRRALIRDLKVTALKTPKGLAETVFTVISSEKGKEAKGLAPKEASAKYKQLLPEEREHYNHIVSENKTRNKANYAAWVESLTPEEVRKANNARRRLKTMGVKGFYRFIKDARQVKRPATARSMFLKERYASGDMHGLGVGEANRLITREWQELPRNEKRRFYATELENRAQYIKDVKTVYNRDIVLSDNTRAAQELRA